MDVEAVRVAQGLVPSDRVLLFAGQYGEGYQEILSSFLRAVEPILSRDPSLILVLSHHPRTEGRVERAALAASGLGRAVMAVEGLTTMELATASVAVLTWTSTVGTQAAFMGKEVVYYTPPGGIRYLPGGPGCGQAWGRDVLGGGPDGAPGGSERP